MERPIRRSSLPALRAAATSIGAVLVVAGAGRLLGFVREVLISSQYGTTSVADAFFTVQQVPTIVSTFVIGPFMIAFVPFYALVRSEGLAATTFGRTLRATLRVGLAISLAMALVGVAVTSARVADNSLLGPFLVIMSVAIVPILVAGLATVVLHAEGHHVLAMLVAAAAPAGMLVFLVLLTAAPIVGHTAALPVSFVAGTILAAVFGWLALTRSAERTTGEPAQDARPLPGIGGFRRELTASTVENVGFTLNQSLTVFFAAGIGGGAVAINAYAYRIASFAFSLVSPVNIQAQTWMTTDESHRRARRVARLVGGMGAFAVVVATVLIVAAGWLVQFIYLRGSFTEADAVNVTALLTPYAVYGAIVATNQFIARYLYVLRQGVFYTRVMIAAYVVGNSLKVLLVGPIGLEGLIWASVVAEGTALAVFVGVVVRRAWLERAP